MSNAREILDRVDRLRRTAHAAEVMRAKIRLFEKPVLRQGLLGFRAKTEGDREQFLDADETLAVYEALADVRNRLDAEASELEKRVTVQEAGR